MPKRMARMHMEALPGCEYHLYVMLREALQLTTFRETVIVGLRCMYALGHDPALRQILFNVAADVKTTDLEALIQLGQKRHPNYPEYHDFTWKLEDMV